MIKDTKIPIIEMIMSLSRAIDLVNRNLSDHHNRVAYISARLAKRYGLGKEEQNELVIAGAIHDLGAISLQERLAILNYEMEDSMGHAELGYRIVGTFQPFDDIAKLIRHHHVPYDSGAGMRWEGEEVSLSSHILHLADRIEILMSRDGEILSSVSSIEETIRGDSGTMFHPDLVDVFLDLSAKESFWLDATCRDMPRILKESTFPITISLDIEELLGLARFFARIIDLRSHFTATHSSGVAAVGEVIAGIFGFSGRECMMMRIAGYLHDLGKLAVPSEILEKESKLDPEERCVIRTHTFHTYRILESIQGMSQITEWAAFHHERLDGSGYPFHLKGEDISLGARIMAVADIFTALTEDRPYRPGMDRSETISILEKMVEDGAIDGRVVNQLAENYGEVNTVREFAQNEARKEYDLLVGTTIP